jgi:protocatechuate 3,4-dioxygenase beta subunit
MLTLSPTFLAARRSALALAVIGLIGSGSAVAVMPLSLEGLAPSVVPTAALVPVSGTVAGTVFRDYNANGRRDTALQLGRAIDAGVAGVEVRAVDRTGTLVGQAITASDGTYVVQVTDAETADLRIEFQIPDTDALRGLQPSTASITGASDSSRGSTIQFVTLGDTGVDLGLAVPGDHCQDDPQLVTCVSERGVGSDNNVGAFTIPSAMVGFTNYTANASRIGASAHLGAIFGIGVDRTRNVYLGTYVKRHIEYGPAGATNTIYRINLDDPGEVHPFVTLPGELPEHDPTPAGSLPAYSGDVGVFTYVGRIGLGDVDVSPDGRTIVAVDMDETDPKLYFVPIIGSGSDATAGAWTSVEIPRPDTEIVRPAAFDAIGCPGLWHPMGLGMRGDRLLVGGVCGAEDTVTPTLRNGPHLTQATAFVLEYEGDPARDGSGTFRIIWADSLGYERGCIYRENPRVPCSPTTSRVGDIGTADWGAWNEFPILRRLDTTNDTLFATNAQPMLANIEILDTGGLILGFRDRYQDQSMSGSAAWSEAYVDPAVTNPPLTYPRPTGAMAGGDIRRICMTADGLRTEQNGTCPSGDLPGGAHIDGSGQREYFEDAYTPWGTPPLHGEVFTGSLASLPGYPGAWTTAFDVTRLGSQGVYALGSSAARLGTSFRGSSTGYGTQIGGVDFGDLNGFRKGIGLSDLEAICDEAPMEIGDRVWWDFDGDGIQDAGEPGIAGVTVSLYDSSGALVATTLTDANGQYWFSSTDGALRAGEEYVIAFDNPANYRTGGPLHNFLLAPVGSQDGENGDEIDSDARITADGVYGLAVFPSIAVPALTPGDNIHTFDAGFTRSVAVGDRVWLDLDGDGRQDPGEPGLAGVTVRLFYPDGTPVTTLLGRPAVAVSDPTGRYIIEDLLPGDYIAEFDLSTIDLSAFDSSLGFVFTVTTSASPGDDSNPDPATGRTPVFTIHGGPQGDTVATTDTSLTAGHINPTIDAGVIPLGSIGDLVWFDTNGDGLQQPGEPGIADVTVRLLNVDGAVIATTTTNANGSYLFDGLPPGSYTVEVEIPSGHAPTIEGAGSPFNDSSGVLTSGSTTVSATTTLGWGSMVDMTLDFGFVPIAVEVGGAVLLNSSSLGVAGVTVSLLNDAGEEIATTTTAADGSYLFTGVAPGDYTTAITVPAGYEATTTVSASTSLTDHNEADRTLNFSMTASPVTVGGTVWFDASEDAVRDPEEPRLGGVTLILTGANGQPVTDIFGAPVLPVLSGADGSYQFGDLLPGVYTVSVMSPVSMSATTATVTTSASLDATTPQDLTLDFGFYLAAVSVIGFVWADLNGDAATAPGESGLAGVSVTLFDATGSAVATTTTDASGRYVFSDLEDGAEYEVRIEAPGHHVASTSTTGQVTASAGGVGTNLGFGMQPFVSVGDFVWFDTDRDGIQDPDERGIAGVTLTISNFDGSPVIDVNGEPVGPVVTGADGRYEFTHLPFGHYRVTVSQVPTGLIPTLTGVGDPAFDSSYETALSMVLSTAGDADTTLDFGFWAPRVSVGDRVWYDTDNNGIQDLGEPGMSGVQLRISRATVGLQLFAAAADPVLDVYGNPVGTATTDANGMYEFVDLPPGTYTVSVTDPDGFDPTLAGVGSVVTDSSSGSATSLPLTLDGQSDMTLDFGFWQPSVSVGDRVWFDTNKDGIQDEGEPGIAGVTVTLTLSDGSPAVDVFGQPVGPIITDANGNYLFTNLPLGTYKVSVTPPAGMELTTPTLTPVSQTLTAHGESDLTLDVGFWLASVTVGDLVWFDLNNDGIQDPDESGIEGVTLTIARVDGDPVIDLLGRPVTTTITDADGRYRFDLLPPGAYQVTVTPPAGYGPTLAEVGEDRSVDSSTRIATTGFLAAGEQDLSLDFGFVSAVFLLQASASVGGIIWWDVDADGTLGDRELFASDVVVRITQLDGSPVINVLGVPVADEVTMSDGAYRFDALPLGEYLILVIGPDGTQATLPYGFERGVEITDPGLYAESIDFGLRLIPPPLLGATPDEDETSTGADGAPGVGSDAGQSSPGSTDGSTPPPHHNSRLPAAGAAVWLWLVIAALLMTLGGATHLGGHRLSLALTSRNRTRHSSTREP